MRNETLGVNVKISIIIPARNAADTIAETLRSVTGQTFVSWEALVVDDGSTDDTQAVVTGVARQDHRIRLLAGTRSGAGAARNLGIEAATGDALLFLDADDLIRPTHLEALARVLDRDPPVAAAYSGWARFTPNGATYEGKHWGVAGDLFEVFGRACPFPIHACLIRRAVVAQTGGFEPALTTCEDWDLWQRIARTGARFRPIPNVGALYRTRPTSASLDPIRMLHDGFAVLERGHAADPRVPVPDPSHAQGLPAELLQVRKLGFACWSAGLLLGQRQDAGPVLSGLAGLRAPDLEPEVVAVTLCESILLPQCLSPEAASTLWPGMASPLHRFLTGLEEQAGAPGLARRAEVMLERLIFEKDRTPRPVTLGLTCAVSLDPSTPLADISVSPPAERLRCEVVLRGETLGVLELPIFGGLVKAAVISDAIAAQFGWDLLGRFFSQNLYRIAAMAVDTEGRGRWREIDLALGHGSREGIGVFDQIHAQAGWAVFLQELWSRLEWPIERFYDPEWAEADVPPPVAAGEWLTVEVAEPVPAVVGTPPEIAIAIQVGGATLGAIRLAAPDGNLTAQTIRAAITGRAGLELYRAAVREALVGAPLDDPRSLRDRLAARSRVNGLVGGLPLSAPPGAAPPGWQRTVARMWAPDEGLLAVGRWMRGSLSSSAARRASLPVAARGSVERLVHREAEPLVMVGPQAGPPSRIEYLPELLARPVESGPPSNAGDAGRGASAARQYGRHYFEHLFAIGEDPWSYTTPYEELKYAHTMSLMPAERPRRALELGCAEGHFTTRLAPAVDELLAADISEVALGRAAERCRGAPNIEFVRLDLFNDPIPGAFDLIVCSEILYYVGDRFALVRIAEKLAAALSPGGALVMAHANVQADEPGQPGFTWDVPFGAKTIGETFAAVPTLQFDSEIRTDAYRIHRFIRSHLTSERPGISRQVPCTVIEASAGSLSPDVQPGFSVAPGRRPAATGPQAALADRVPILMYHRIGPAGSPATRRYRVSCADFEEQLRYLRDAGFRSADLDEWAFHAETKIALDASCVVITFDDGYRDFGEYAWPLLKRYGFTACVFLVSDRVGGTNQWDAHYGEIVPLLDWSEIQELRAQGVRFGSHGRTHVPLTSLSPSSIAEELLASRAVLEERLGSPVTAVAFPYGDADQVVQHLAGAAGYLYGLSSRPGRARFSDSLLALPRIEIAGTDRIRDFILKLGG